MYTPSVFAMELVTDQGLPDAKCRQSGRDKRVLAYVLRDRDEVGHLDKRRRSS